MLESLAPDVIGLPLCIIDDTWTDRDITDFYWDMHRIGQEYAANVRWVGDEPSQELAI
jgi:hypothetical protein